MRFDESPNLPAKLRLPRASHTYGFVWQAIFFLMWFVYVLKSLNSDFIYIGSTNDIGRRLKEHNSGIVTSTRAYLPYKVELYVAVETESKARRLEKYFKTGSGKAVLYHRMLL